MIAGATWNAPFTSEDQFVNRDMAKKMATSGC